MDEEFPFTTIKLPMDPVKKVQMMYGIAFGIFGALVLGLTLYTHSSSYDEGHEQGKALATEMFKTDAISSGYGMYDAQSGKFRWKKPAEALVTILENHGPRPTPPKKEEPKVQIQNGPVLADEPQLMESLPMPESKKKNRKS